MGIESKIERAYHVFIVRLDEMRKEGEKITVRHMIDYAHCLGSWFGDDTDEIILIADSILTRFKEVCKNVGMD